MVTWTLIGEDTFTASSNTNLNVWTPTGTTPLSGWTKLTSQTGSAQAVVYATDDTLTQPYIASSFQNPYVVSNSVNAGPQKISCTGFIDSKRRLILHAVNAATYWNGYSVYFDTGTNTVKLDRVDDGVINNIASSGVITAPSASDVAAFESDGAGNFILSINAVSKLTKTDSTYTAGKMGVAVTRSFSSAGMDNINAYHEVAGTTFIPIVGRGPGMALAGNGGGLAGNVYGGH